jgi:creatinine amidohydrolase
VATAAKGDRLLTSLVEGWVRVLTDIYHFCQPQALTATALMKQP